MATQKALVLTAAGQDFAKHLSVLAQPILAPAADEVQVRIIATAVNPVDWKRAMYGFLVEKLPTVLGCDLAGVVSAVGSAVKTHKVGDAVWAYTRLFTTRSGSFAEYAVIPADMARRFTPDKPLSFAQASTLGVAVTTSSDGLHFKMGLRLPGESGTDQPWIAVYGGASAVGQAALQWLQHARYTNVIAVASAQHGALLTALGAAKVIDYTAGGDIAAKLRDAAGGHLQYAYDAIGGDTAELCAAALAAGGKVVTTGQGYKSTRTDIGKFLVEIGANYDKPAERAAWAKAYASLEPLVANGSWKATQLQLYSGLDQIVQACVDQAQNKFRGAKPVVMIAKP